MKGFRFAGVSAGIKSGGAKDVAVLVSETAASAAAVFTRNRVAAAPVKVSKGALRRSGGKARAVVVNSGNANACTGARGMADARAMAARVAGALDVPRQNVIVSSTGVIGVPLPMDRVTAGIDGAMAELSARKFDDFSQAILTTDKGPKTASGRLTIDGTKISLLGCTKGAGMIAPNMATTLSFVVTDAQIAPAVLREALSAATDATFNAITVDGDTSTNDMILVMANGTAGNRSLRGKSARLFGEALTELLSELAHALMRDGEGVHHVVNVRVRGARSTDAARKVAREIANSSLVKTAIAGQGPNWGRILAAAGNAGVPLDPEKLSLRLNDVLIAEHGVGVADDDATETRAAAVMAEPSYDVIVDLGASHEYVTINANYRT